MLSSINYALRLPRTNADAEKICQEFTYVFQNPTSTECLPVQQQNRRKREIVIFPSTGCWARLSKHRDYSASAREAGGVHFQGGMKSSREGV